MAFMGPAAIWMFRFKQKYTSFLAFSQLGILEWYRSTKSYIAKEVPWIIESAYPSLRQEVIPE